MSPISSGPLSERKEIEVLEESLREQAAEIAALRGAIRWLDLHRGELPSGMDPDAYPAYVRALKEGR